ncbi:hypothetical protein QLQ85_14540 [Halomonas sp. M4R5S39]|uniref:Uncharacterized protein n=1 Tax=Halomonas kalidii TaxID=3043293 RepID=A0ABT6VMC6_9GAMM|nr:hypothetical protein [Halomonas kalidii]MDI5934669.1 hypothetical protein [Halomonas kalidii]MDI5986013.1 hypothetical protein [Halomonas kalidii]
MLLLLSGEGPSDIGVCYPAANQCQAGTYQPGPMAWVVDQLVEHCQGYEFSHLENGMVHFVSKSYLVENKPKAGKKPKRLRGKKTPKETTYYYENARSLARKALSLAAELDDQIIAVLFRDGDGTASAGRGEWQEKYNSMLKGFDDEGFKNGVAMLPKPKSEAWLLCALKPESPYQHCAALEKESGNDRSQNPLKDQLDDALGGKPSTDQLNELVTQRHVRVEEIDMPSLKVFKNRLREVVEMVNGWTA